MPTFLLDVNGARLSATAEPATPLLWVLRDTVGLTGTKYGCGIGACGSCTVLVDGEPRRSCGLAVKDAVGRRILTIEGLASGTALHAVQRAWVAEEVVQCGYCQSGQILAAVALLARAPRPTERQIDDAMSGILCRCGTYGRIRAAVKRAAAELGKEARP
ncbi:MAG TPA: (2Fe-2S)-binding protein [Anaeromyxobacteraceae bacterium]|nr:(2Fe-2S)-binding protein [Anaeromyxobacteraceae bacterium]